MPPLIWSHEALRDLDRLHRFLRPKNPAAARQAISAIRRGVKILGDFPLAGRQARDLPHHFHEWPIPFSSSGYIVLYKVDPSVTVIVAVRHAREVGYEGP